MPADPPAARALYSPALVETERVICHGLFACLYRMRTTGLRHLPSTGGVLVAANHSSYMDPPVVAYAVRRRVFFLAWFDLFQNPAFAAFIRRQGAMPVGRDMVTDLEAFRQAAELLRAGEAVCVFPEGGRNDARRLDPFRPGVARLAMQANVPLVPMYIQGAAAIWPRTRTLPSPFGRLRVRVRPPLFPDPDILVREGRRAAAADLLRRLERRFHRLAHRYPQRG